MNSIYNPPAYVPTEHEHKKAYYRYILEHIFYDTLLSVSMYRRGQMPNIKNNNPLDKAEEILKGVDNLFIKWHEKEHANKEVWELEESFEQFIQTFGAALSEEHCGDCTKTPCACTRCHAEMFYEIPSSVTWIKKKEEK